MRHINSALAAILLLSGSVPPLHAQVYLRGQVVEDETGTEIPGALVEVFDGRGRSMSRSLTDEEGAFTATLPGEGGYRLRASRIGYRGTTTPILWTDGYDHMEVEIRLDPQAVLLAPLEVTARSRRQPSPVLENFRERQRTGLGYFFTREDIDRIRPFLLTDLIARVPGIHLESSGRGGRRTIYVSRGLRSGRDCPTQIFVDGFLLNRQVGGLEGPTVGFTLDEAVSPQVVEGVEVYHGLSTVPAAFLTPQSHCGVVAVWTRRGG